MDQFLLPVSLWKILKIKNLNRVIISKINVNYIGNKIELLLEAVFGNIDSLWFLKRKRMSLPTL